MSKFDIKKETDYKAKHNKIEKVEIPTRTYITVTGKGVPGGSDYIDAIKTLYPAAYKIKFASKAGGEDYVVPPLQGFWWAEDMAVFTDNYADKKSWQWKLMIALPLNSCKYATLILKDLNKSSNKKIELETLTEGTSYQVLHVGPYDQEGPLVKKLHKAVEEAGMSLKGQHHEIYLSDPRRTTAEKLRTIIRYSVEQ